jgi:uncharacterized protein (UPF0210 family)
MKIRSVTCFATIDPDSGTQADTVGRAGRLVRQARAALEAAGLPVQTVRLATQPLSLLSAGPLEVASELWPRCAAAGFEYLSLGPVLADAPGAGPSETGVSDQSLSRLEQIPDLIRATEGVFAAVLVARRGQGVHLEAIRRTARIIREIAHTTELGFGNLRLAMLANVGPHTPFFPAAYHDGGPPALAIATEAADLAVTAFSEASSLREAQTRLVAAVEAAAGQIAGLVEPLAQRHDTRFVGIDFTLAPFPEEARSIGTAVERLGVERFGVPGTLFVAWLLTDCVRRAHYPRCGFNGLMLPVLEDATLANRSREGLFTVNDLLLWSAVCGTGLDTVPLPGDVSEEELAGILLDVAALALRLDKPLTARLMPIPGARAGDMTEFDFEYFANGRVLDVKGLGSPGLFARGEWLVM